MSEDYCKLDKEAQKELLQEAQQDLGIQPLFLEKDYWVCMVLKMLFQHDGMRPHLCFRGGTSLSKVHHCIDRFSEDIDVALEPIYFSDYPAEALPHESDTRNQRESKHRKLRRKYREFMRDELVPHLKEKFAELNVTNAVFELDNIDQARDPFVLKIHYPSVVGSAGVGYVSPIVKLELSGRANTTPSMSGSIVPYLAELLPVQPIKIRTVSAERTFWEKAFILHETNTRAQHDVSYAIPLRLARHYYDLCELIRHGHYDANLFQQVKNHRNIDYHYGWVDYDTLVPDRMNLLPPDERRKNEWATDYKLMEPMLRRTPESFESILSEIQRFVQSNF